MKKWIRKILKARPTHVGSVVLVLIALNNLLSFRVRDYNHIPLKYVHNCLYYKVNGKVLKNNERPKCNYGNILQMNTLLSSREILPTIRTNFSPYGITNGSYLPEDCNPSFSVAILVPYRNRRNHLDLFVPYMHNFLRKQQIHYKIFVIEQEDENPWNKGVLYNIGAKYALADEFPCLILHDVDLLPLDEGNLYACLEQPRHMSARINIYRFILNYETLVGGVLAIRSDQYVKLNGFSNRFKGWGGEDDDFADNILAHNLAIVRLPPHLSRYTMMPHKHQEEINADRFKIMMENSKNRTKDGMDTVQYKSISINNRKLYTLIGVKL